MLDYEYQHLSERGFYESYIQMFIFMALCQ